LEVVEVVSLEAELEEEASLVEAELVVVDLPAVRVFRLHYINSL
jgi:hypothetical protein